LDRQAETLRQTQQALAELRAASELERKQAEEALAQERQHLQILIDNLPDAVYIKDAQGRKTVTNRVDLNNIGRPESEVLGKTDAELFPPEVAAYLEADDHAVLQTGQPVINRQELLINTRGQHIWLLTSKLPLYDDNGQIIGLVGIGHNITELKQAEDLRREREACLHAILNNSPFLMWLKDTEGHFLAVNEVFAQAAGMTGVNELIGKTDFDIWPPELAERYRADDQEVMESGRQKTTEEPIIDQGVAAWFETFKRPIWDETGQMLGTTGFSLNITERKQAEESLRESHHRLEETLVELRRTQDQLVRQERLAAVGQLAAGIAHDFNNILTSILGFAELIQMAPDTPAPIRQKLEHIITPAQKAALLVRQILDFSRKSIRQVQQLELGGFIQQTLGFLRHSITDNIRMQVKVEPGKYRLNADPTQLQQALTNLVVNARDAMPEGGRLTIELTHRHFGPGQPRPDNCTDLTPGEWVALAVTDTGTGIPADVLPHIFEPFFTTKGVGQGTGLGLSQVYGIVRQHGGCIEVSSREGQGTTFTLYLPGLVDLEINPAAAAPSAMQFGSGQTILLVEDEATVLDISRAMLKELNYRVMTATNGLEALSIYATHKAEIDLVLTDMMMPELDGPSLFRQLKAQNPAVKVVMMTGYPLGEDAARLAAEGVVGWLHKPMSIRQLAQMVAQVWR
jgi:PAS domain S-box-containing protein